MSSDEPPRVKERYTSISEDLDLVGFHDCHVSGVHWDSERFEVAFDLDYIVEWVQPALGEQHYRFWISPAQLRFSDVEDLRLELSWISLALDCSIREVHRRESRTTPSGKVQWCWEIELTIPVGSIIFWATGFELMIQGRPRLSATQKLSSLEKTPSNLQGK